jgi:hypothetical protein
MNYYTFRMNLGNRVIMPVLMMSILAPTLIVSPAMASPNFVKTPTIEKNSDFSLTAHFNATGLANSFTTAFLSSSGGDSGLICTNLQQKGYPSKLYNFNGIKGQDVTIQPVNGEISNSTMIGPPQVPSASDFCTVSSMNVKIESITYDGVVLHIQQNGADVLTFDFGSVHP